MMSLVSKLTLLRGYWRMDFHALTDARINARTLSYSRFIQYVRCYFPGVRLKRTAEDVCDCCVRLDVLLQQPDISEEERETVLLEKSTHLNEAIAQRRFVSNFVKEYTALHAPKQVLSNEIIRDTTDDVAAIDENDLGGDERATTKKVCRRVQIQAEDYGGDVSNGQNNVYFYDERGKGKNADALCSLRLLHHLSSIQRDAAAGYQRRRSVSVFSTTVWVKNKSKAVMMLFALLSVISPTTR
ncbi:hypothetical protein GQ600_18676 [Phytophthora cactorum]|nr:hypothetical protein GQ600_18676 [Phytophthora cactorum]